MVRKMKIDDSGKKFSDRVGKAGRVFNIVSGSLNLGTSTEATVAATEASNGEGFGLFYPDQGLIVLNPSAIAVSEASVDDAVVTTTAEEQNQKNLLAGIIAGGDFEARRTENVSTAHYFVRATNKEYNFSNNPTFTTGSDGTFLQSTSALF